ncbi:ABC transporter ATP-binding protein [Coraliomargarita akajimensis]|uniref:ABC transporter related protein n=1 Tax=Coraliomargarita akajimensis (strain DSM 45221 / IAM 15411 / JCM 23193 / KCTC 12865 / 04OKA010-24) TaxID=583355 RepID=D5EL58_CORAD|nr:ABC transporter ATP-binding protein [Coraliomargarita akajimensis]ADE53160.1 ABC transporter related protein [Coraliomargarita akajimensis DSM 45221]
MQPSAAEPHALHLEGLTRTYQSGDTDLTVLADVNLSIAMGERVAIVGPSGSGKTTLLGLCAGLDSPSSGTTTLLGTDITQLNEDGRAAFRGEHIGFVFQNFQLIPSLTALENVTAPLELRGETDFTAKAAELLKQVGLGERMTHYPVQLSGGEQQRVALARAFINQPKILFADEPTGNLDGKNGEHIVDLLFGMNRAEGTTLVLVTHDPELANHCDRTIRIQDGRVQTDTASR